MRPPTERDALQFHGAAGAYDHPDYQAAMGSFCRRHVCRLPEWPDCLNRTVANLDGNQVYLTVNSPDESTVIGNLKRLGPHRLAARDRRARADHRRLPRRGHAHLR